LIKQINVRKDGWPAKTRKLNYPTLKNEAPPKNKSISDVDSSSAEGAEATTLSPPAIVEARGRNGFLKLTGITGTGFLRRKKAMIHLPHFQSRRLPVGFETHCDS
jgi:hypothetical protein